VTFMPKGNPGTNHGSNATTNRFSGRNRKINEPGGQRLSDRGRDDQPGIQVCKNCGSVHTHDRWYRYDQAPAEASSPDVRRSEVLCPACKQIQDRNPGGILTLSGAFLAGHRDEIMNLFRHEDEKAQGVNPLEKIMEITDLDENSLQITTTNEFLVQRLGRAVHSAYSGDIEYKFAGDDVPVRVYWKRD